MYKIKISVCSDYDCTKSKEYNNDKVAHGWATQELDWTAESVRKLTTLSGISCNEYSSNNRKSDDWVSSRHLMLDFDSGITAKSLLEMQKRWSFDSYIFSSQNHQKSKIKNGEIGDPTDRLRVLIPLAEPIKTEPERRAVEQVFVERYPQLDRSFMGRARYYAHGTTEVSSFRNSQGSLKWKSEADIQAKLAAFSKRHKEVSLERNSVSVPPSNMSMMFEKCPVLKAIETNKESSFLEGTDGHMRRLFLGSQCVKFGQEGRKKVHNVLKNAPDYDAGITDRQLDSIEGPPQTCEQICGNKRCSNICKADGNSPIKFGYMDDLFVFLEKQTSSFAYLDRRDEQLYFVDSEKKLDIILEDADQKPSKKSVLKVIFDPSQDLTVDKIKKTINLFRPTDFMVSQETLKVIDLAVDAPSINNLLSNLIPVSVERGRFVNWLAGIMQTRSKQLTAWVFMGKPGAGKNVLLDHVLKPLFGDKQAIKVEDEQLKNPFNGWLQNAILIAFNEVAHDNRTRNSINSKVKAIITDNDIMINEKNVKVFTIDNHANALFFSNNEIPVLIEENDRRFNVVRTGGNMRKQSWFSDPEQFFVDVKSELDVFAQYLINYNYDPILAKTVISNGVKDALVDVGMTRYAEFSSHLKANDVDWFIENMDSLFPTSTIQTLGLNGSIAKDSALSAFKEIYQDDRVTKSKLTKELILHGIRIGALNGEKVYRWD